MSPKKLRLATQIVRTLKANGYEAYFVGGCVRDRLLKRQPTDYDIASNAGPKNVKRLFSHCIPVGERFGILIVRLEGESFEVSTFREEGEYRDGRRPSQVEFSDAKSDALRRDFTVNGLFYDPIHKKLFDWVGGKKDLQKGILRTIGNPTRRFEEDKLRMLRAVRFTTNLGFRMDAATRTAIRRMSRKISVVSQERIRDELIKSFTGPYPGRALDWLDKTGLLKVILPEIEALKGVQQPKKFHPEGDVYKHTKLMMSLLRRPSTVLAFGSLLHDIGKPKTFYRAKDRIRFNNHDRVGARMSERILERLRFSNELKRQIVDCVDGHMRFKDAKMMRRATLKRLFQRETFITELEQHRADCLASHKDLTIWRFLKKKHRVLSREEIRPNPFLRGGDLLALGFTAGPLIGQILRQADEKQLEGDLKTKEDALRWARSLKKRP